MDGNTLTSLEVVPRPPSAAEAVGAARLKNAVIVAWCRAVVVTGTLVAHAASGVASAPGGGARLLLHALFAAVAVSAVALLNARWRPAAVAAAAAVLDVLCLAAAGLALTEPGVVQEGAIAAAAFMVGLTELFVLASAMTLPLLPALAVGAGGVVTQLLATRRAGVHPHDLGAVGATIAVFAAVAAWAGARMVRLARNTAVDRHAARLAEQRVEEALAAKAEAAAQRDALLDARTVSEELSAAIVHDLKNPLATLLQYAALAEAQLQEAGAAPQVLADLRLVGDEGRRLAKLIGDLLLVHRLERGGLTLRREPTAVAMLLERVAETHRPRARERGVTIQVAVPTGLMAPLDPELTLRLLENLLSNSLRHVAEGDRIELASDRTGDGIRLAVRNSGEPVPAEARGKLFEKYVSNGRREWHNAGLGLYLCRLVAEAHGGACQLVDRPGWSVSFEARFVG
ncbi:MAG TPA: HAMP domain-containing sensor histidine kinase [Anaeromyxobacteraceae bacterium]|nr:HAMP domain-containing sensor histidine kinase [Anaeromyxobacteraceae bacterium]